MREQRKVEYSIPAWDGRRWGDEVAAGTSEMDGEFTDDAMSIGGVARDP